MSKESDIQALGTLHRAVDYLRSQFDIKMSRDEAVVHFQARGILIACADAIFTARGYPSIQTTPEAADVL
jgi:hypothetical protein